MECFSSRVHLRSVLREPPSDKDVTLKPSVGLYTVLAFETSSKPSSSALYCRFFHVRYAAYVHTPKTTPDETTTRAFNLKPIVHFKTNPDDKFSCSNGLSIESSAICDGHADCSDGSDETNNLCARQTCQSYAYRCKYGACVHKSAKCNGKNDCVDGSDEDLPECKQYSINSNKDTNESSNCLEYQYKCKSGQCIDSILTCDGTQDCKDGSDETTKLCKMVQCQKYTLRCNYGACVSKESKCDGVRQCVDGSDEEKCDEINLNSKPITSISVNNTIQSTTQSNTRNLCVLPTVEGVIYSYHDSNRILPPGTLIGHHRAVNENCEVGYHNKAADQNVFRVCQENGKWISSLEKLCFKMCLPLISDSLDITCNLNDCGKPYTISEPLIANGKEANYGTAPWNVGIYRLNKINSNYDLICGGSIITPILVVSAAHCFKQNDVRSNFTISINDGLYKIAVGKYERDFTVEKVYLNEYYRGETGSYANDIAVIVLENRISISSAVAPIVGWGETEKGKQSSSLLEAFLPYIDHDSCRRMHSYNFDKFITPDKFCAGSSSALGQGVNRGDSGAGLTFLHSDSYYFTGIVSVKDPNITNPIAVFTDLKQHIEWIREFYNKYTSYASDSIYKSNKMLA
ncbi:hypothetical protein AGLY_011194 [Aphis glycines]|uniref:Peptidase S1 domain-containing protein n=1 Tax=Aphis glycines TaxID=307491 RepID=A0A6G0TD58_APHGL|nr:hypothetical protein AGLY_011194 [Aphis glycines]